MNTTRGSTSRSRRIKMAAAVGAGPITAGLAAARPAPAHDPTIDQTPGVTMTGGRADAARGRARCDAQRNWRPGR